MTWPQRLAMWALVASLVAWIVLSAGAAIAALGTESEWED